MENIDKLIENLELATEPELRWTNPEDAYIGCGDVPDELCQKAAACIRQLRKENAELRKRTEWLPIETAPKDGTQILCYEFCNGHNTMYLADYAWFQSIEKGSFYSMGDSMQPTHWMPFQAPPEGGE